MAPAMAVRALATTFEARSLMGISSSRMAGGISGRTSVMRRSSVRRNITFRLPWSPASGQQRRTHERPAPRRDRPSIDTPQGDGSVAVAVGVGVRVGVAVVVVVRAQRDRAARLD